MLQTGWWVTGTWPMRTKMGNRTRSIDSNALASSVVLACRPRPETAGTVDRRGFLVALRSELPKRLRELQQGNIAPVDLAQAAIGPGMAVFSRYRQVTEADGTPMQVRTALVLINQVLDEVLAEQEGDFDTDSRWCVKWFDEYEWEHKEYGRAETLATALKGLPGASQTTRRGVPSQARRRAGPHAAPRPPQRSRPEAHPRHPAGRATGPDPGRGACAAAHPGQGPRPGRDGRPAKGGLPMTDDGTRFAFWGRCSTEDRQDPEASRAWQYSRADQLVAPRGGVIVAEYFDVDKSRSIPPARRPEANRLLAELANTERGFDGVVVGEPQRAFYGNQFGNTFPLFEHYGVPLWVPEVGGPIDSVNEAHDMIMSTFGSFSKGERNRIKTRVRTTMAALAQTQGRFLGGRPPYGHLLIDAGPHPNPAKAADGKRLHALAIDEEAAAVVQRIFAEFLAGYGIYAMAERLTADGIPCPSAHDPDRNRHRCGIAWSKGAIRAILTNPRYTGRQVWNRKRKDEVLLDVH